MGDKQQVATARRYNLDPGSSECQAFALRARYSPKEARYLLRDFQDLEYPQSFSNTIRQCLFLWRKVRRHLGVQVAAWGLVTMFAAMLPQTRFVLRPLNIQRCSVNQMCTLLLLIQRCCSNPPCGGASGAAGALLLFGSLKQPPQNRYSCCEKFTTRRQNLETCWTHLDPI